MLKINYYRNKKVAKVCQKWRIILATFLFETKGTEDFVSKMRQNPPSPLSHSLP